MLFEITYESPDDEAGNFEPKHLVDSIQRQHYLKSDEESSHNINDEQQKLLDIEQNIANIEKKLNRGKHSFSCIPSFSEVPCLEFFSIVFSINRCRLNTPSKAQH